MSSDEDDRSSGSPRKRQKRHHWKSKTQKLAEVGPCVGKAVLTALLCESRCWSTQIFAHHCTDWHSQSPFSAMFRYMLACIGIWSPRRLPQSSSSRYV